MLVEAYLGNPPQRVIDWIKNHSQPTGHSDTRVTYTETSGHEDWSGEIVGPLLWDSIPNFPDIETIDFGNTVTDLGDEQFYNHENIKSVEIPGNIEYINYSVFANCYNLTTVIIHEGVLHINNSSFQNCSSLTNLTIPNTVTSIEADTFNGCSDLSNVTFEGKDRATVQGMSNLPFGLNYANENGVTIHCTDGDIFVSYEG